MAGPQVPGPLRVRYTNLTRRALCNVRILCQVVEPVLRVLVILVVAECEGHTSLAGALGADLQRLVVAVESGNEHLGEIPVLRNVLRSCRIGTISWFPR